MKQQEKIEKRLFRLRYKSSEPPRLFLYDVTSSYLEGMNNELADWGYNRDGKKGKLQIVIGLLTDGEGVPVSVEVFRGNTQDTKTFLNQVKKLAGRFEIEEVTVVGDRGMIKSAQIKGLKEDHFSYISAITKPQTEKLIKKRVIQLDLFSEQVCEVENNGIRYILRRNPVRAKEIEKTREEKIKKVQAKIKNRNEYLAEHKRAKLTVAKSKIELLITKLKIRSFAKVDIEGRGLSLQVDEEQKKGAKVLDGCYVIKTELKKTEISAEMAHQRYKDLAQVEYGFRTIKTGLLETRPVYVRKEERTRAHVFVVMLSYIIVHELRKLWVEMDMTVQEAIKELSTITCDEIKLGGTSFRQIPQPRDLGATLIRLANVSLPVALPCRNVKVATRKKLPERRKRFRKQ